jgi:hypothetical protein
MIFIGGIASNVAKLKKKCFIRHKNHSLGTFVYAVLINLHLTTTRQLIILKCRVTRPEIAKEKFRGHFLLYYYFCAKSDQKVLFNVANCTRRNQRQSTLDCRYLLYANIICSSKTFFPVTILGICYVFPVIDIIPLFYRQTISLGTEK